jgi:hypothetical protein
MFPARIYYDESNFGKQTHLNLFIVIIAIDRGADFARHRADSVVVTAASSEANFESV